MTNKPQAAILVRTAFKPHPLYKLELKPYFRGTRKTSSEYEATITEYPSGYFNCPEARVVWRCRKPLRREVKAEADRALAEYRLRAGPQIIRRNQDKRQHLSGRLGAHGMLGLRHSEETRAKISAAVKRRHQEGAFKSAALGRPTKVQMRQRLEDEARSRGVPAATLLRRQAEARRALEAARTEARRLHREKAERAAARAKRGHVIPNL